jgi:hypothetical protein
VYKSIGNTITDPSDREVSKLPLTEAAIFLISSVLIVLLLISESVLVIA